MKQKAFTLVELLAVIVVLSIISLITIPIIMKSVNNVEKTGEQQSIIGYARAIEDDVADYIMMNPGKEYNFELADGTIKQYEYKGNDVSCSSYGFDSKENLVLSCCKVVNGSGKTYDYIKGKVKLSNVNSCNAVSNLLKKVNDEDTQYVSDSENSHQMYTFSHPATEQTDALIDYRYIGSNPYNYVDFNGETWRIIGIFTVEDEEGNSEQRIKIIKDESIGVMEWDELWSDWSNSSLKIYLNENYYTELNQNAREMIEPTKTYLGGINYNSTTNFGTADEIYALERGTNRINTSRVLNDVNNIMLIYASDYVYTYAKGINDSCYNDVYACQYFENSKVVASLGWLYNSEYWTVSHLPSFQNVLYVSIIGDISYQLAGVSDGVRPVTYLKSSVKISSGNGSKLKPYKFEI